MNTVVLFVLSLLVGCALANTLHLPSSKSEKIVGGWIASDGQFPYQVSLKTLNNEHFCGGSIIDKNWVITVAHCVNGRAPSSIMIIVGTNSLLPSGTAYGVSQVIIHEAYNPSLSVNNIALLRINGYIQFGPKVQSIPLANQNLPSGALCTLTGWGFLYQNSQILSKELQFISLSSISLQQCQNSLPGYPLQTTNVCTLQGVGKGACNGDSGGPLVFSGQLFGVLSWGVPCALGKPDVYSSIPAYRQWIRYYTGI